MNSKLYYLRFARTSEEREKGLEDRLVMDDDVELNKIHPEDLKTILSLIKRNATIRECGIDEAGCIKDLDLYESDPGDASLPYLRSLTYRNTSGVSEEFVLRHKKLEELHIAGDNARLSWLGHLPNLKYLNFFSRTLTSIQESVKLLLLEELTFSVKSFPSLESFSNLDAPQLKKLDLSSNQISDLCDFEPLAHLTGLEELNISQNEVRILDVSSELPNLRRLDLSNNQIEKIVRIKNLPKLEFLDLCVNPLTALEGFGHLPSLKEIHIYQSPVVSVADLDNLPRLGAIRDFKGDEFASEEKLRHFVIAVKKMGFRAALEYGHEARFDDDYEYGTLFPVVGSPVLRSQRIKPYLEVKLKEPWGGVGPPEVLVYVAGKRFRQCAYLLLQFSTGDVERLERVKSIDDAAETLNRSLHGRYPAKELNISPETEFWAHASNLQAWVEHDYDTRLLHRSLAFPLLKRLTELGDPAAKRAFKEEIARRYAEGNQTVRTFLEEEGYLELLTDDEKHSLKPI
ncbi:MAG: hypothetical protein GF383_10685 [Candidatus Lokiarchaeota archaeon]|nr:hypothetical protein [Candidatus Lokiarchaeota archaeon]MBD3341059.1 hypothetical protein [Candidatus Lokiarchaeota archaeon]